MFPSVHGPGQRGVPAGPGVVGPTPARDPRRAQRGLGAGGDYAGKVKIDLHTHSNVSDGTETPGELIRSAAAAGLDVVALTDHDSTDGWAQASAAALEHGVALVPGMEISCRTEEGISVHLLSYLHDPAHPGLLEEITKSKDARLTRAQRMVSLLAEDYPLSWDDVIHHVAPGATVGRPHIADALVAAGAVADRTEAFTAILSSRSRYFVQHYAPEPALAVELVRAAGGVPVFAHPVASARGRVVGERTNREMDDAGLLGLEVEQRVLAAVRRRRREPVGPFVDALAEELAPAGGAGDDVTLLGLEVEHRDNPEQGSEFLRRFAAEHGLFMTGSSDYHGAGKVNLLGENVTSPAVLARIEELGTGCGVVRA